jgi:hypothetical protein
MSVLDLTEHWLPERPWTEGGQLLTDAYRSLTQQSDLFFVDHCCRKSLAAIDSAYIARDVEGLKTALEQHLRAHAKI